VCDSGYTKISTTRCVASFSSSFELRLTNVNNLPSSAYNAGTPDNLQLISQLQTQIKTQMRQENPEVLDVIVSNIRQGSVVADVEVIIDKTMNDNPEGTFLKLASDVDLSGQPLTTVSGQTVTPTASKVTLKDTANTEITSSMTQCQLRAKTSPCNSQQVCVDDTGVAQCTSKPADDGDDDNSGVFIGLGIAIAILVTVAVVLAVVVLIQRRKKSNTENKYVDEDTKPAGGW